MIAPREGRWIARPRTPSKYRDAIEIALNLVWLLGLLSGFLLKGTSETVRTAVAVTAGAIYLGVALGTFLRRAAGLRRSARDRHLSDRLSSEEYLVEIEIQARGRTMGIDRGLVWFEGPLLGFSGECASFLIAATDLAQSAGIVVSDFDVALQPLRLASDGDARVKIRPLFGDRRRYHRRMRRFLRERQPSDAPRQWPPLQAYEPIPASVARS